MICSVYRSEKKAETYLYLARGTEFEDLPDDLRRLFGEPSRVMGLVLSSERPLAQVNVTRVIESLKGDGSFLQLPPKTPTEEEITRWLTH